MKRRLRSKAEQVGLFGVIVESFLVFTINFALQLTYGQGIDSLPLTVPSNTSSSRSKTQLGTHTSRIVSLWSSTHFHTSHKDDRAGLRHSGEGLSIMIKVCTL